MTDINYNFAANRGSLDDVNSGISGITTAQNDINTLFQSLSTVYEGRGASALLEAHQNINSMLEDIMHNMSVTQQQAQEQQEVMQALDAANAAAF